MALAHVSRRLAWAHGLCDTVCTEIGGQKPACSTPSLISSCATPVMPTHSREGIDSAGASALALWRMQTMHLRCCRGRLSRWPPKQKRGQRGARPRCAASTSDPKTHLGMADLLPRHPKRWGGHQPVGKAPATNPPIPTQLVQVTSGSACCKPHNPVFVAVRYGTQELVFDDEGNEVQLTDRFRHPINKPTVVTCQVPLPGVVHMPELVALPSPVCLAPP